ncbi:hypothetical protein Pla52o_41150 [Novipirellula galeiformis]|uniref:Uncharacterized protein n=1 Tax=Novipirellula galeiformis TaxID=2528004 RepID=A0A5C6C8Q7_9BACT|nr:hypothetical protein Pla52o_41150 [Novipirellula galeiformis]
MHETTRPSLGNSRLLDTRLLDTRLLDTRLLDTRLLEAGLLEAGTRHVIDSARGLRVAATSFTPVPPL